MPGVVDAGYGAAVFRLSWIVAALCLSAYFYLAVALNDPGQLLCVGGVLALLMALSPLLLQQRIDPCQPILLVALATFLGTTARAIYMVSFDTANTAKVIFGQPLSLYAEGALAVVVGVAAIALGYAATRGRVAVERCVTNDTWNERRLFLVAVVTFLVSIYGIYLFFSAVELAVESLADLSRKRVVAIDGGEGADALGYPRWLASFGRLGLFAVLTYLVVERKPLLSRWGALAALLALPTVAFPFMTSNRSPIIQVLLFCAMLVTYRVGRLKPRHLALVLAAGVVVAVGMGFLRTLAYDERRAEAFLTLAGPIDGIIGSGNFLAVEATSMIVDRMPGQLDPLLGTSLLAWITGPVPRALWAEKPIVNTGAVVMERIYGLSSFGTGRPPGVIAEGYMNFGYSGLIALPLAVGIAIRWTYNSVRPLLGRNKNVTLIYLGMIFYMAFSLLGGNLSKEIMAILQQIVPLALICWFVTSRSADTAAARAGSRRVAPA